MKNNCNNQLCAFFFIDLSIVIALQLFGKQKLSLYFALIYFYLSLLFLKAIQKRSHGPMYKLDTENEAKRFRATKVRRSITK